MVSFLKNGNWKGVIIKSFPFFLQFKLHFQKLCQMRNGAGFLRNVYIKASIFVLELGQNRRVAHHLPNGFEEDIYIVSWKKEDLLW